MTYLQSQQEWAFTSPSPYIHTHTHGLPGTDFHWDGAFTRSTVAGFHNTLTLDLPLGTHLLQAAVYVNGFKDLAIWSKVYSLSIRRVHYSAADLAVCCSVLQCVAACCSVAVLRSVQSSVLSFHPSCALLRSRSRGVLRRVAACCSVSYCDTEYTLFFFFFGCTTPQPISRCVAVCCSQCCSMLQRVAVFFIVE